MIQRSVCFLAGLLFITIFIHTPDAKAKKHAPGGFSKTEIEAVSKLLKRYGVVALSEMKTAAGPPAMTLAVKINAPREVVFDVFEDPLKFNFLSTLFEEAKVLDSHDGSKAYSWASRHQLFSVVGTNTITLFPPRRIDVSMDKSSLGSGTFSFNLYKDGDDKTLCVLSGYVDVQSSEWLIRFLVGNSPPMRQAMNVAIGLVILKGAKFMAENIHSGKQLTKHRTWGKRTGPLRVLPKRDLDALTPLLERGAVILSSSIKGGRLRQATVVERVRAPAAKFVGAVATPEYYPNMIKSMSDIVIHERTEQKTEFSWTLGLSVFGLTTRSRLTFAPDGVSWEAIDGDLKGALWRWQVVPESPNSCIVAYHSWADILGSTYILEKSMRREPYLEHGFLVGSNMVMLQSVIRAVENK